VAGLPTEPPGWFREWVWSAKANPAAATVVKRYNQRPRAEVYDLQADPHERRNRAADPQQAARPDELPNYAG
jgi:hypothetical protein